MDYPILSSLILLPSIGALFIFFTKSNSNENRSSKYISLFVSFLNLFLSFYLWYLFDKSTSSFQFLENQMPFHKFINFPEIFLPVFFSGWTRLDIHMSRGQSVRASR